MNILWIIVTLLCGICAGGYIVFKFKSFQIEQVNVQVKEKNQEYDLETQALAEARFQEIDRLDREVLGHTLQLQKTILQERAVVDDAVELQKSIADEALIAYIETLEFSMTETEVEFDIKIAAVKAELEKIMATRAAAIQAVLREKEIQEQGEFFKISVSEIDLADIEILDEVKPKLRKPEVLSKLIWTTYYQKGTTTLCHNVLGDKKVCGIYKITDTTTNLCYIGQSVDVAQRWKDHVKAGLGAGAAANNKLYTAMHDSGVHNFTFELLEETPSAQLNEKEKYYIELYQSSVYGLNTVKGVNK